MHFSTAATIARVGKITISTLMVPKFETMYIDPKPRASKLGLIGGLLVMAQVSSTQSSIGIKSKLAIVIMYPKKIPTEAGRVMWKSGISTMICWDSIRAQKNYNDADSSVLKKKLPPMTRDVVATTDLAVASRIAASFMLI